MTTTQTPAELRADIEHAAQMEYQAAKSTRDAVIRASIAGQSWAAIADALMISKQTAYNRYRADVETFMRREHAATLDPEGDAAAIVADVLNPSPRVKLNLDRFAPMPGAQLPGQTTIEDH